jgi:hypothetical protein
MGVILYIVARITVTTQLPRDKQIYQSRFSGYAYNNRGTIGKDAFYSVHVKGL